MTAGWEDGLGVDFLLCHWQDIWHAQRPAPSKQQIPPLHPSNRCLYYPAVRHLPHNLAPLLVNSNPKPQQPASCTPRGFRAHAMLMRAQTNTIPPDHTTKYMYISYSIYKSNSFPKRRRDVIFFQAAAFAFGGLWRKECRFQLTSN